jgi:uncharacterized membrane protein (Fun14 family)
VTSDPPPLPSPVTPTRKKSLWKPILITMVCSFFLAFGTCFVALGAKNGIAMDKLLDIALAFFGAFALSVVIAIFYGLVRLDRKYRKR